MVMGPISYRMYLTMKVMVNEDVDIYAAAEAVSTTALEHPEWDMDGERATWEEWGRRWDQGYRAVASLQ